MQDCKRRRWIAGYFQIDGKDHPQATSRHEALPEDTSCDGTSSDSQNTLRLRHRFISLQQRPPHVLTYRPDYEHDIGSPWSGGQKDAQPVHVVQRIVQLLDLVQASSAISCIHHHDVERPIKGRFQPGIVLSYCRRLCPFITRVPVEQIRIAKVAALAPHTGPEIYGRDVLAGRDRTHGTV